MGHIQYSSVIPAPLDQVFNYVSDYNNRSAIVPQDDLHIELLAPAVTMGKGVRYEIQVTRFGLKYPLEYVIEDYQPPHQFIERQVSGVFEEWLHTTKLELHGEGTTVLTSIIEFSLPVGIIGTLLDDLFVRNDLIRIIKKSHENVRAHFLK